jgi:hypothetical protein
MGKPQEKVATAQAEAGFTGCRPDVEIGVALIEGLPRTDREVGHPPAAGR